MKPIIALVLIWSATLGRADALPGTDPLTPRGDLAPLMIEGIDRFLLRQTELSIEHRSSRWNRDTSSPERYAQSVAPNRRHLAEMIGVVDARTPFDCPELVADTGHPALVGRASRYEIFQVRWPVVGGIYGEGLLLAPTEKPPIADVIALPDADQTPEMIAGLTPGVAPESQFARRLAESGCRILIPCLIDRSDAYSLPPSGQRTNQPHREYVYRPAFEMGRHVIGYEVQKVLAAVDWFSRERSRHIGVIGYGEGGLLAFYSAALDTRVECACVSGYFDSRQDLWQEPIYRNVFGLLSEFGDAELASLIAPRPLVIEACLSPEVNGPPAPRDRRSGAAPGRLIAPKLADVRAEFARARELLAGFPPSLHLTEHLNLQVSGEDGRGPFGSNGALQAFLSNIGVEALAPSGPLPTNLRADFDPQQRLKRQIDQMQEYTRSLVGRADDTCRKFWANADPASAQKWEQSTGWYREYFGNEVIGRFEQDLLPPKVRTRQILDEPQYDGYEVMLDVYPDVFASGILLVPKGIRAGERRPVVVCQHGLEGRPSDVADPNEDNHFYHRFACRLAEQGFITYSPQNPYVGQEQFRTLVRKAHPIKKTLFSIIVSQHRQATEWLATLPFVDPSRIAFYGLSYGGKTAMRVPALLPRYCLSICSGDFNQWTWKTTSLDSPTGYPGTIEYDMFEWNMGNTFNYGDIAGLIAPRPFMVERGHHDGVASDEWVAYEYAKVRRLYSRLGIADRTRIEFFDGPHTINGVGTFEFLHEQLKWPANDPQDPLTGRIRAIVTKEIGSDGPGAVIAVVRSGKVLYRGEFGHASIEKNLPLTSSSVFDLASCAKQFTAMAMMILAERGKVSFDDDVRKYLPELRPGDPPQSIRVSDLLHMTSGLSDYLHLVSPLEDKTNLDILHAIANRPLDFPTGTRFSYCDTNYVLLGLIVERVSGQTFRQFMEQNVFGPAGMKRSVILEDPSQSVRDRSDGFVRANGNLKKARDDTRTYGDGQVMTSLADLILWNDALRNGKLVRPQTLDQAFTAGKLLDGQTCGYGFGWFVHTDGGKAFVDHGGRWAGTNTYLRLYPRDGLTVIVLSNLENFPAPKVGSEVAALFDP